MSDKSLQFSAPAMFKRVKPKTVSLPKEDVVKSSPLRYDRGLPLVIEPRIEGIDLIDWAAGSRPLIEEKLLKHGAILFRGFDVASVDAFERFASSLCPNLFNENGEHVRDSISDKVYTPVFYPPDKQVLWHNENSFNQTWPRKIWFGCLKPADRGGETPIADSRKVFELIEPAIRERFIEKKVMYVRNYGTGLGLDWRTVFRVATRAEAEERCRAAAMELEWLDGDRLQTWSVRPAVVKHPITSEMTWFNQAQHWHVSCLDPGTRESLKILFTNEKDYPRNCYFGDGSRIDDSIMQEILAVYAELEVAFQWQRGDILMLDNLLTAHGRNAFAGERKLLVSMAEMLGYD